MALVLKAHYDGEHIILDEPAKLPANASLIVTVLPSASGDLDTDRAQWAALGRQNFARAYSDDEPEYTMSDLK